MYGNVIHQFYKHEHSLGILRQVPLHLLAAHTKHPRLSKDGAVLACIFPMQLMGAWTKEDAHAHACLHEYHMHEDQQPLRDAASSTAYDSCSPWGPYSKDGSTPPSHGSAWCHARAGYSPEHGMAIFSAANVLSAQGLVGSLRYGNAAMYSDQARMVLLVSRLMDEPGMLSRKTLIVIRRCSDQCMHDIACMRPWMLRWMQHVSKSASQAATGLTKCSHASIVAPSCASLDKDEHEQTSILCSARQLMKSHMYLHMHLHMYTCRELQTMTHMPQLLLLR